jgi:hypothetical protein
MLHSSDGCNDLHSGRSFTIEELCQLNYMHEAAACYVHHCDCQQMLWQQALYTPTLLSPRLPVVASYCCSPRWQCLASTLTCRPCHSFCLLFLCLSQRQHALVHEVCVHCMAAVLTCNPCHSFCLLSLSLSGGMHLKRVSPSGTSSAVHSK